MEVWTKLATSSAVFDAVVYQPFDANISYQSAIFSASAISSTNGDLMIIHTDPASLGTIRAIASSTSSNGIAAVDADDVGQVLSASNDSSSTPNSA